MIPRNRIDTSEITSRNKGKEILLVFVDILLGICFIYYHDSDNLIGWAREGNLGEYRKCWRQSRWRNLQSWKFIWNFWYRRTGCRAKEDRCMVMLTFANAKQTGNSNYIKKQQQGTPLIWNQNFCLCLSSCLWPASHHGAVQCYSGTQESSFHSWLSLLWLGQFTCSFLAMERISALPLSFPFRWQFFGCIIYLIVSLFRAGHEKSLTLVRTYIFSFTGFFHNYSFGTFPRFLSSLSA